MEGAAQAAELPSEVWLHVFSFGRPEDLGRLECVCKSFSSLIRSSGSETSLWKSLCQNRQPDSILSSRQWVILNLIPRRSKGDLINQILCFCRSLEEYRRLPPSLTNATDVSRLRRMQRITGFGALTMLVSTLATKASALADAGTLGAWAINNSAISACVLVCKATAIPAWALDYGRQGLFALFFGSSAPMASTAKIGLCAAAILGVCNLACRRRARQSPVNRSQFDTVTSTLQAYDTNIARLRSPEDAHASVIVDQILNDHLKNDVVAWRYRVSRKGIRGLCRQCLDYGLLSRKLYLMRKMLSALNKPSISRSTLHDIYSHFSQSINSLSEKQQTQNRSIMRWVKDRANSQWARKWAEIRLAGRGLGREKYPVKQEQSIANGGARERAAPSIYEVVPLRFSTDMEQAGFGKTYRSFEYLNIALFKTRLLVPVATRLASSRGKGQEGESGGEEG